LSAADVVGLMTGLKAKKKEKSAKQKMQHAEQLVAQLSSWSKGSTKRRKSIVS